MPLKLKSGYSHKTVAANIETLKRDHAMDNRLASAIAFAHARESYFKAFPDGALPLSLAYQSSMRLARHYHHGHPVLSPAQRNRNPVRPLRNVHSLAAQISEAGKRFEAFSGHKPDAPQYVDIPEIGKAAWILGKLDYIGYTTIREGEQEQYQHTFKKKARPLLAVTHDGKRLIVLSGAYHVTERGIEDL